MRRRPWAVLLAGAAAALVCIRLGFWQLDRLAQRRATNARVAVRLAQPALAAESIVAAARHPAALDYRRARLSGRFDFSRQVIVVARPLGGRPGVHVVTPLRLADGTAILVERGWAPAPDGRTADLAALIEPEEAACDGVLLLPRGPGSAGAETWPLKVRAVDPALLAPRFPYGVLPVVLRRADSPAGALRPVPLPERTEGPHLSYAVQWFAFAAIALVGSAALARKTAGGDRGRRETKAAT
jgi:surfeit locus 1 family protein